MKYFEKIDQDLLNNRFLTANEKIIYVICYSYKNAPYGCRVSHKYLMQRTGIKTKKTLIKCLDNLALYGLMARKQIGQGSNDYVFEKEKMQEYIQHNINKRKKISLSKNRQFKSYLKALSSPKVIPMKKVPK